MSIATTKKNEKIILYPTNYNHDKNKNSMRGIHKSDVIDPSCIKL